MMIIDMFLEKLNEVIESKESVAVSLCANHKNGSSFIESYDSQVDSFIKRDDDNLVIEFDQRGYTSLDKWDDIAVDETGTEFSFRLGDVVYMFDFTGCAA